MTGDWGLHRRTELTRRDFLARGSAITLGAAMGTSFWPGPVLEAGEVSPGSPTVFRVRAEGVVIGKRVHKRLAAEMVRRGLAAVTAETDATRAWRALLRPDDVVALKFNRCGSESLGTTVVMAEVLIESLLEAGFPASQLVPVEVPPIVYEQYGTARPTERWQAQETSFGSGADRLAAVLDQVTAIVNIPFLKTHNIAGITCCLKNLSHALVKHPARFHADHCSPFIADIVALPAIRGKLRLHVVNALRAVFDGGPEPTEQGTFAPEVLLFGADPVALDTVGTDLLNLKRQGAGLPRIEAKGGQLGYLAAAARHGLGCADFHAITVRNLAL